MLKKKTIIIYRENLVEALREIEQELKKLLETVDDYYYINEYVVVSIEVQEND